MPLLLYTYLFHEILATFFASLVILAGVLFLGRLIPFLDIILTYDITAADFLRLSAYLLPQLLLFALPMAAMMAVILAFTRMAMDHEILALKAGGISVSRMAVPVILLAFCLAGLTAGCSTRLIPTGQVAMKKLFLQLAREKIANGLQEKRFSDSIGGVVVYVDGIEPESRQWQGIYLADYRDGDNPTLIMAKSGSFQPQIEDMVIRLDLNDGSMHRSQGELTQTIGFKSYRLTLPLQSPQYAGGSPVNKVSRSSMTQKQLRLKAEELGTETEAGASMLTEYHKRLVLSVACFILTLLGFPLGLMAGPGRPALGLPLGLLLFISYYVLLTGAEVLSTALLLPPLLAMWLPNLIFCVLTIYLFHHSARETAPFSLRRPPGSGRRFIAGYRQPPGRPEA